MPKYSTEFSRDWLNSKDNNGHCLRDWCGETEDKFCGYCYLCSKTIDIRNRGKSQLLTHADGKRHKDQAMKALAKNQPKLMAVPNNAGEKFMRVGSASAGPSCSNVCVLTPAEEVARAEIIWTLKVAETGYSYSSCSSLTEEFSMMFPDSKIAKSFSLGANKISYVIAHGLGPFFHSEIIEEVKSLGALYTLSFDEATNDCGNKQLDLHLRWWGMAGKVKNNYLCTCILGHATADVLKDNILKALKSDGLDLKYLLMVSSDGPNVNKKLLSLINDVLKSCDVSHPGLVQIGTCNLHIVHNSFAFGLDQLEHWAIPDFLDAVFKYFHKFPARKEDLQEVQQLLEIEETEFKRYVNSRWLSLVPVIERVVQQYQTLEYYFLTLLPKMKGVKNDSYYVRKISQALRDPVTVARLHFLKSVGNLYSKFLTLMQADEPLIHLLYEELTELIRSLMRRFIKAEKLDGKSGRTLCRIDLTKSENLLDGKQLDLGEETKQAIKSKKLTEGNISMFRLDANKFLVSVVKYLVDRVPLDNSLLRNLKCLHPLTRTLSSSEESIKEVAKELKLVLPTSEYDILLTEWRMYASEDISDDWYISEEYDTHDGHHVKWQRIDHYWNLVLKQVTSLGTPKYPVLSKVVKAALTLSHGQAHVERGFSLNKTLVTAVRSSLKQTSINGLRTVQDKVKQEGGPACVPITATLIHAFQKSYRKYKDFLDEQKKAELEKAKEANKRKEEEKQIELKRKQEEKDALNLLYAEQKKLQKEVDASKKLIDEANVRLKKACSKKKLDANEIAAAQALLDSGNSKLQTSSKMMQKVSEDIAVLAKKRKKNKDN